MKILLKYQSVQSFFSLTLAAPVLSVLGCVSAAYADGSWQMNGYTASNIIQGSTSNASAECETFAPYAYSSSKFKATANESEEQSEASANYVADVEWITTTGASPSPLILSGKLALIGYIQPAEVGAGATSSAKSAVVSGIASVSLNSNPSYTAYEPSQALGPTVVQTDSFSYSVGFTVDAKTSASGVYEDYPQPGQEDLPGPSSAAANATASLSASTQGSSA